MKNILLPLITAALTQIGTAHKIPALDPQGDVYKTSGPNDEAIYGTTTGNKTMLMVYTHFSDQGEPEKTIEEVASRSPRLPRRCDQAQRQEPHHRISQG